MAFCPCKGTRGSNAIAFSMIRLRTDPSLRNDAGCGCRGALKAIRVMPTATFDQRAIGDAPSREPCYEHQPDAEQHVDETKRPRNLGDLFSVYFIMPIALSMCILQPLSSFFAIISLAMFISFMAAAFLVASVIFVMDSSIDFMFASEQSMLIMAPAVCAKAGTADSNSEERAAQASSWIIFI